MAFRLRVIAVEYDSFGETVLTGVLEAGQIGGGDAILVPTANGTPFQSVVASMEGPGPEPPFRAEKVGNATLIVGVAGTPPKKDVVVPCVAEGSSTSHALEALHEIVATRRLGEAWVRLRGAMQHQGSVCGAALPHLIRLAPSLTPDEQRDLWIDVGFLVIAGAGSLHGNEPVPGMQEALTQSLRDAEPLALQAFLEAEELDPEVASYFALACVALAGHPLGVTLEEFFSPVEGYVTLQCPKCDAEYEVDGFTDPLRAPCDPPPVPSLTPRARPEWARVPIDLLPGFDAAARAVADAGLPVDAPMRAVWCLVAAMVAAKGAVPWARTLLRLTGHFRCGTCQAVLPIAAMLGKWRKWPVEHSGPPQDIDPAVIADAAGFKPAPGGALVPGDFPLRPVAVPDGLRPPAATEALIVMPGPRGFTASWMPGAPTLPWLPGARLKVPWLASVRDGRTVLAVGDATGAVRLCDPATRKSYGTLFERPGRPVVGMAFAQALLRHLVIVYGDLTVDVWGPDAADGERSSMALAPDRLRANGHSRIVAVCLGTDLGFSNPILFADRDGTVSMWEAFGVRLSDPLLPDPAHYDVVAVAASAGLVVTAGRASRNLRIWQPSSGKVSLVPLAFAPEWLTFTGTTLTAGNADGAASFSVGAEVAPQ